MLIPNSLLPLQVVWRRVTARRPQVEAPVLASSTTAATHGLVATAGAIWTLSQWDWQSFGGCCRAGVGRMPQRRRVQGEIDGHPSIASSDSCFSIMALASTAAAPVFADEVNTPAQTLLMLFSTAYFVEDTWYCATLPADALMVRGSSLTAF